MKAAPSGQLRAEPTVELVRSLAGQLRAGLRSGAVRRMIVPPRETAEDAAGTKFISMPAVSPDYDLYINKVATIVAPDTPGRGATVTSVVPMFSVSTGRFLGLADGTAVTNLKCAAVTALVTESCAVTGAAVLGIIGSGVQARQQYLGVSAVRGLTQVRIFSRNPAHAAAFARDVTAMAGAGVNVVVCDSAAQASRGVDILITATTSADPLPISPELPGHVHVNCVGAHTVAGRELSQDLLRTSVLIVEDRRTAVAEAGPLHHRAVELDALGTPAAAGFAGQRTIFSSTGCAYLDLITCAHLLTADERTRDDETELEVAARRAGIELPADLKAGVLHGYRGLRELTELTRTASQNGASHNRASQDGTSQDGAEIADSGA
jgi:ornithine cyclodeaminase/alanine dehydrogenase-like protein (mu-crystallin family)